MSPDLKATEPGRYRKRPVVVEAITFDELVAYGLAHTMNIVRGMPWSFHYQGQPISHENDDCYLIPTLEGMMKMMRGDMLITGVKGEIYPCKPDIFAATYEPANSVNAPPGGPLSFDDLRRANVERVSTAFEGHTLESWSETDWACAAAGEIGEMCNMVKKRRRGEAIPDVEVAKEMADTVIYLDILAARMGIDLGEAVRQKFNEVSARRDCPVRLPEAPVA